MRVSERQIHLMAEAIVGALIEQGFVHLTASRDVVVRRIYELLVKNFQTEQEIEEEAEDFARQHARQMAGMDQHKIIQGIKDRLAKERGFTL